MLSFLLFLENLAFFDNSIELFSFNSSLYDNLVFASDNSYFKSASIRLASCVHALTKDFDGKDKGLLDRAIFFIIILQGSGSIVASFSSSRCFPSGIISRRIRKVELEALDFVESSVH